MPVVIIQLPESANTPMGRPDRCPNCGSQILQSWGQSPRSLQDIHQTTAEVHRYRCSDCKRTFRHYPPGMDRGIQSLRLRRMAAVSWVMGLSSQDIVELFKDLGVELSRMTIWRDGRDLAKQLCDQDAQIPIKKYTIDPIYLPGVSSRLGVVVVLDPGQGKRIVLGTLDEFNPRHVKSWLDQLTQGTDFRVTISGTDYLNPTSLTAPQPLNNDTAPSRI